MTRNGALAFRRPLAGLLIAILTCVAVRAADPDPAPAESIGTARMLPDRTVELNLVARDHGRTGHARITYPPADPYYAEVLAHIGGLRPGEVKPVRPWPDSAN